MRSPIGKKVRFEVFKRDDFSCVYCGATPPSVILQIDHIHPVAQGGKNDIDNLITSCQSCNIGKGANLLSNVPQTLKEKAQRIREQEEQLQGYYEVVKGQQERITSEMIIISEMLLLENWKTRIPNDSITSMKRFLVNLGFYEVKEAAEIARNKYPYGGKKTFLYFCGICHNKMRG